MSDLTSTVPAAFDALYGLLNTAGQAQRPPVQVFHTQIGDEYEPNSYVILKSVEHHQFDVAALGSYAHEETYDLCGEVSVFAGDIDPQTILVNTWALYQTVVMTPVVANRGQPGTPVLAISSGAPLWIVPAYARYSGQAGQLADGTGGFAGTVEFAFSLKARITVP